MDWTKITKKGIALTLSALMALQGVSMVPQFAFAESDDAKVETVQEDAGIAVESEEETNTAEEPEAETSEPAESEPAQSEAGESDLSEAKVSITEDANKKESESSKSENDETASAAEESAASFSESETVDGIKIHVSADEGVFPEGATMTATRVDADAALTDTIEEELGEEETILRQFAFDITIHDKDGNEIQPDNEAGETRVSFSNVDMDGVETPADNIKVFHFMDEDAEPEVMDADIDGESVQVEANHFSIIDIVMTADNTETEYTVPGATGNAKRTLTATLKSDHTDIMVYTYYKDAPFDDNNFLQFHYDESNEGMISHTLKLLDYIRDDGSQGYSVIFVKPSSDEYIMTSQYVTGDSQTTRSMQFWPIDGPYEYNGKGITGYPRLEEIIAKAKAMGYTYLCGYTRRSNFDGDFTTEFGAQKVGLNVQATSDKGGQSVTAGDTLHFTFNIKPTKVVGNKLTYDILNDENQTYAVLNGQKYYFDADSWTENADGSFSAVLPYQVTAEDVIKGNVTFSVHGALQYDFSPSEGIMASTRVAADQDSVEVDISKMIMKFQQKSETLEYDGKSHAAQTVEAQAGFEATEETINGVKCLVFNMNGIDYYIQSDPNKRVGLWCKITRVDAAKYDNGYGANATIESNGKITGGVTVYQKSDNADVTDAFNLYATKGTLTITPKPVELTSASAEKEYNGKALTKNEFSVTAGGFVSGQGVTAEYTGSQVAVGESDNTFTAVANSGTKLTNYDITYKYGTLKVTAPASAHEVEVVAQPKTVPYDGNVQTTTLSGTEFTYQGHNYKIEGLSAEATSSANAGEYTSHVVGTPVVSIENEDGGWDEVDPMLFAVKGVPGKITITPLEIKLNSGNFSKVFDGTPLKCTTSIHQTTSTLVPQLTIKYTGSQTEVGESANSFEYAFPAGFNPDNYKVIKNEGKLTVTPYTDPVTITANSSTHVYDGETYTDNGFDVTGLPEGFEVRDVKMTADSSVTTRSDNKKNNNVIDSYKIYYNDVDFTEYLTNVTTVAGTIQITASDLEISKSVNQTVAEKGDSLTYTIEVTNKGDADAVNTEITDTLGDGLAAEEASGDDRINGSEITWSNVTIPAGEKVTYTVKAQVTTDRGSVENTVSANVPSNEAGEVTASAVAAVKRTETVKRTITYTYRTEDGETAAETKTQKLTFDVVGSVEDNEYEEPDYSSLKKSFEAVDSPSITGWTASPVKVDEKEVSYTSAGTLSTGDVTEHVVYQPNHYQIRFDKNGGKGSMEPEEMEYSVAKALTHNAYTREGYAFQGWSTSADEDTVAYTDGQSVQDLTTEDGGEVTLYAVWLKDPDAVTVSLAGTKNLTENGEAKAVEDGQFSVKIAADPNNDSSEVTFTPEDSVAVAAGNPGSFEFKDIEIGRSGDSTWTEKDYKFIVTENQGQAAGYTYDSDAVTVTVHVTFDKDSNTLSKTVSYEKGGEAADGIVFDNEYQTPDASAIELSGSVDLKDEDSEASLPMTKGQFAFQAALIDGDEEGYSLSTDAAGNAVNGGFDFGSITFSKAGDYTFEVSQNDLGAAGYTYDTDVVTVNVHVQLDNSENKLVAEVTGYEKKGEEASDVAFHNTYRQPEAIDVPLGGTKTLTGDRDSDSIEAGEFTFDVTAGADNDESAISGVPDQAKTQEGGAIDLGSATIRKAGSYQYTIKENAGSDEGMTYDSEAVTVTITVALDSETNTLEDKVVYTKDGDEVSDAAFENSYAYPSITEPGLEVTKTVDGDTAEDGDVFEFIIEGQPGQGQDSLPMPEKDRIEIEGNGSETYSGITFSEPGVYNYKITETAGDDEHYQYDSTEYAVVYNVTEDDNHKLHATRTITEKATTGQSQTQDIEFTNTLRNTAAELAVAGTKTLSGGGKTDADIEEGLFRFYIAPESDYTGEVSGVPTGSVAVAEGGAIDFGTWTFHKEGEYTFRAAEEEPENAGYTLAPDVTFTVEVTKDETHHTLKAVIKDDTELNFENTYTAPKPIEIELKGSKTLRGDRTTDSIQEGEFSFNVTEGSDNDKDGYTGLVTSAATEEGGAIDLGTLTFSKPGSYEFVIAEEDDEAEGMTYDDKDVTVEIDIDLNERTNQLEKSVTIRKDGEYVSDIEFANEFTYVPVTGEGPLVGKIVSGDEPNKDSTFHFAMEAQPSEDQELLPMPEGTATGKQSAEVTIKGEGDAEYGAITFTEPGVYSYKLHEIAGKNSHYKYDKSEYTVTYKVTADAYGVLDVERTITKDAKSDNLEDCLFNNVYKEGTWITGPTEHDPPVKKIVKGRPKKAATFTFELKALPGKSKLPNGMRRMPMPGNHGGQSMTVTIKGSGEKEFGIVKFTKPGTYVYQITEINDGQSGYKYDDAKYIVTYEVISENGELSTVRTITKDGEVVPEAVFEFTNTYDKARDLQSKYDKYDGKNKASKNPKGSAASSLDTDENGVVNTGDSSYFFYLGLMILALIGLASLTILKKRRDW